MPTTMMSTNKLWDVEVRGFYQRVEILLMCCPQAGKASILYQAAELGGTVYVWVVPRRPYRHCH